MCELKQETGNISSGSNKISYMNMIFRRFRISIEIGLLNVAGSITPHRPPICVARAIIALKFWLIAMSKIKSFIWFERVSIRKMPALFSNRELLNPNVLCDWSCCSDSEMHSFQMYATANGNNRVIGNWLLHRFCSFMIPNFWSEAEKLLIANEVVQSSENKNGSPLQFVYELVNTFFFTFGQSNFNQWPASIS